ncbi:CBS domain-containing protein [Bacillus sp. NTK034]|uniref:CBS domain-containing protein n=1 Tax=Bacillus sp. NTK034 TaxID=2802176 RepID=UPI001A90AD0B|nr:CBS domain-containing protein [Bacillus sp. NTK034]MBN8201264.1 CBS domain-containing protein [Bacillus sp. NTK034]
MEEAIEKNLSERFEAAFNRIHKALKQSAKNARTDKFYKLIEIQKNHSLIRLYEEDLHQFAKLRNAIVHEKIDLDYYIAEPHFKTVEKIERIAGYFEKPKTALSIAATPVFYFYEDGKLTDVLAIINKFSHSQFPIYSRNDEYSWILTSADIVKWMAEHFTEETIQLKKVKIKELFNKKSKHKISFAGKDTSIFELEDTFEESRNKNEKLEGIIVTENGKPTEKPKGMITAWDLLEADSEN